MHLGRFHTTIHRLSLYFNKNGLIEKLDLAINNLTAYVSSRSPEHFTSFKASYEELININEPENNLLQPYAKQTLDEIGISDYIGRKFSKTIERLVTSNSYDQAKTIEELQEFRNDLHEKITEVNKINSAFTALDVEYETVQPGENEIGLLLPRELTGENIENLGQELQQINKVFRAINEITGNEEYSPRIRTISSSWWQIFLELDHTQIAAWIFAIERIVSLFKTNLEIKVLQKQLEEKELPKRITSAIEKEVEGKIKKGIAKIASEIRKKFSANDDEQRLNELEIQLRQGLTYIAKRLNQGAEIEINISLPSKPKKPDGADEDQELLENYQTLLTAYEEQLKKVQDLQGKAFITSQSTLELEKDAPLAITYEDEAPITGPERQNQ